MLNPEVLMHGVTEEAKITLGAIATTRPSSIRVAEEVGRDPVYLVPLHQSPDRFETIKTTVRSIVAQKNASGESPRLILSDNGVSPSDMRGVTAHMHNAGIDVHVVDAQPRMPSEKNAAYARNKALEYVAVAREQEEHLRGPIALIDSDSAFVEDDALLKLQGTLNDKTKAQSVNGVVSLVTDVEGSYNERISEKKEERIDVVRALPSLWRPDGTADLAGIVAFSSQVAGKTTGQLIRPGAVGPQNAYVRMPNGSAEDMISALYQSKKGDIYVNEGVHIIDQDRPNPAASRTQQMQWGEDHVYLQHALTEAGVQKAGIQVLEPSADGWVEWMVAGSDEVSGLVICPSQLTGLLQYISRADDLGLEDLIDPQVMQMETTRMANVLTLIEERRGQSEGVLRTELPHPVCTNTHAGRFTDMAQIGRLLGNMLGVHALHADTNVFTIPNTFLYGMRQQAQW